MAASKPAIKDQAVRRFGCSACLHEHRMRHGRKSLKNYCAPDNEHAEGCLVPLARAAWRIKCG